MQPWAIVVTDRQLVPPWGGNRVRILGLIRALRAIGWRVALACAPHESLESLRLLVDGLAIVRARSYPGGDLKLFDVSPYRLALERISAELRPALVIAEYAWMAPAMARLPRWVERWVDCHDVLHERTERFQSAGLDPWTICTRAEEVALLSYADLLVATQERETRVLGALLPDKRVVCLLPEIELPRGFRRERPSSDTVLAVGALHAGNKGIGQFATLTWPGVVARVPRARLKLIGAIGADLPALPGVDALGWIADLGTHYESAAVVVCPVTVGTGVKIKLLEALRLGKATVATTGAAEGLPQAEPSAWVEVESLAACGDAVAALLTDPARRAQLEAAAFEYGERYLSGRAVRKQIQAQLPGRLTRSVARLLG